MTLHFQSICLGGTITLGEYAHGADKNVLALGQYWAVGFAFRYPPFGVPIELAAREEDRHWENSYWKT